MTDDELLQRLCALVPGELETIMFRLQVPIAVLPSASAAPALRVIDLIRYLHTQQRIPELEHLLAPARPAPLDPARSISIARLPITGNDLFGREREGDWLNEQWSSGVRVASIIAWGGVGKSSLVNAWLGAMDRDGWHGAERVFAWSFYDQGTTERVTSSDDFIAHALRWFGDPDATAGSSWEKGERLASLVKTRRTLLILDGLEPLQRGPGPNEGRIQDPALSALVRGLAAQSGGMCLITSRLPVADLDDHDATCARLELKHLSSSAGAALLRGRNVKGTEDELQQASVEYGGHSLALKLLGSYLDDACNGDIRRRREIGPLADDERHGAHARRVMRSYERWFEGGLELTILAILGLFDRPAVPEAIAAVMASPPIEGLTDSSTRVDSMKWRKALSKLRRAGLLASESGGASRDDLDAHPLVREHFGEALRGERPAAWRAGHGRLFDHFSNAVKKPLPETIEEMLPLYRAVRHGCLAERWRESFHVLKHRIRQGDEHVSLKKLGAVAADLGAFAAFFTVDWDHAVSDLSLDDRYWLANSGGVLLRAEGRLPEGERLMRAAVAIARAEGWDRRVAESCRNLASTETSMGRLKDALATIDIAIEFAERDGSALARVKYRDFRAHLLNRLGQPRESRRAFEHVEQLSRAGDSEELRSFPGGSFAALLVELGEPEAALALASASLALTSSGGSDRRSLLNLALCERSLARALAALDRPEEASAHFDNSILHVVESGRRDHLAPCFLDRATFNLHRNRGSARDDVVEAMRLALHGGFRLTECNAHLALARLDVDARRFEQARASLGRARELIESTDYRLRDPSLLLVEARYHLAVGDRAVAAQTAAQARARIEAMGLGGLLGELAEVERASAD
jgi:tetratricopeptide (TPR) repeat protein